MVAVRYPRAEGRDGEWIAAGLEGLWIVAHGTSLDELRATASRSVRQVRDSPARPRTSCVPRSILCRSAALLHFHALCVEKLEFSRSCTQFRHIALVGGHFDVPDDPRHQCQIRWFRHSMRDCARPMHNSESAQTTGCGKETLLGCTPTRRTWFAYAAQRDPRGTLQRPFNASLRVEAGCLGGHVSGLVRSGSRYNAIACFVIYERSRASQWARWSTIATVGTRVTGWQARAGRIRASGQLHPISAVAVRAEELHGDATHASVAYAAHKHG